MNVARHGSVREQLRRLGSPAGVPLSCHYCTICRIRGPLRIRGEVRDVVSEISSSLRTERRLGGNEVERHRFFGVSPRATCNVFGSVTDLHNSAGGLGLCTPALRRSRRRRVTREGAGHSGGSFGLLGVTIKRRVLFLCSSSIATGMVGSGGRIRCRNRDCSIAGLTYGLLVRERK